MSVVIDLTDMTRVVQNLHPRTPGGAIGCLTGFLLHLAYRPQTQVQLKLGVEAIASRVEAIAGRVEAIATT